MDAKVKIKNEIAEYKEKLSIAKETIAKFKEEIAKISKTGNVLSSS